MEYIKIILHFIRSTNFTKIYTIYVQTFMKQQLIDFIAKLFYFLFPLGIYYIWLCECHHYSVFHFPFALQWLIPRLFLPTAYSTNIYLRKRFHHPPKFVVKAFLWSQAGIGLRYRPRLGHHPLSSVVKRACVHPEMLRLF